MYILLSLTRNVRRLHQPGFFTLEYLHLNVESPQNWVVLCLASCPPWSIIHSLYPPSSDSTYPSTSSTEKGYSWCKFTPGALLNLEEGWQAVVRLQIKEYTDKLVREYKREMEESLKGILPLEEGNLMRIHEQKLKRKECKLQNEVCRISPVNSSKEDGTHLSVNLSRRS